VLSAGRLHHSRLTGHRAPPHSARTHLHATMRLSLWTAPHSWTNARTCHRL